MPDASGVPLIVIVFEEKVALTPEGKPLAAPMPVAPVVAIVMSVSVVLIHKVGLLLGVPAVLVGMAGSITTSAEALEVHPVAVFVTVKLYVAEGARPETVVVVPEPEIEPGFIVQLPAGSPLRATLPVGVPQLG